MQTNTILTPVTLWRDFDDALPLKGSVISETEEEGMTVTKVRFSGRQTAEGRVSVYAELYAPDKEQYPAVLVLYEAGQPFDREFAVRLVKNGYGVLCVDYCGDCGAEGEHTVYPADVDYANLARAGRHIDYVDATAKETSWYEWAAVARYAARYLGSLSQVTSFGAVGLRTGGEVLFKVAPYAPLSCMISVCAAGWLAYRDIDRFGGNASSAFDDERHRFIAGVDSQSYAPYVKCPVLLLSAINDRKYNYERVYDTFLQINPNVEKAILFSAHGNGLIGSHSLLDIDLFLDKYLKGRSVFIPKPIDVSVGTDGQGRLVARSQFDDMGDIMDFGVFYTEKVSGGRARDWTRVLGARDGLADNIGTVPITLYEGCKRALVYSFVQYSNNFSVTSKILEFEVAQKHTNTRPKTRVIYTNGDGRNVFSTYCMGAASVADCFHPSNVTGVRLVAGYGGIVGVTSDVGMISYRVGEQGYEPPAGACFSFDAWCRDGGLLKVTFFKDEVSAKGYSAEVRVEAGGKWKNFLLEANDFKLDGVTPLGDFEGVISVMFEGTGEVLVNNVLWM